jgi:tRNA pseudouridine38-40 synthase
VNDDNDVKPIPESDASPGSDSVPTRAFYRHCAPDHHRVRLHVSYDGTDFAGWQRQQPQTHVSTVQGTLETALKKIYRKSVYVLGASRTDAGVHANRQVAHFDAPRDPAAFDIRYALQSMTPDSIVVKEVFAAPNDFHAIACATDKIYKYRVLNRRVPSALRARYSYWVRFPLDLDFLNEASVFVLGYQDFKSFQGTGSQTKTSLRNVLSASWQRIDDDTLEFTIRGEGFLKQMVRNIVGTLIDLNQEGEKASRVREILETRDRRRAGPTAPPQGLFLTQVNYPEFIDNKCRRL